MKVKDGKVYMPDGTVYEMKTPVTPIKPGVHAAPRIPPMDMQRLTPEQRRKLRQLQERFPQGYPVTAPTPKPNQ